MKQVNEHTVIVKSMNFYKGFLFEDTSNLRQNKIGLYNIVINLEKRVY